MVDSYTIDNKLSIISEYILNHINIDKIKKQRKRNYNYLQSNLNHIAFYPNIKDLMFGFPILFKNKTERDLMRKKLIESKIYCPIHWELPLCIKDSQAKYISKRILTIPIDQRYTPRELNRIVSIINFRHAKTVQPILTAV